MFFDESPIENVKAKIISNLIMEVVYMNRLSFFNPTYNNTTQLKSIDSGLV